MQEGRIGMARQASSQTTVRAGVTVRVTSARDENARARVVGRVRISPMSADVPAGHAAQSPSDDELLSAARQGDTAALDRLVPLLYDDLRRVARGHLRRERPGHSLQATALVHEVFLRLVDVENSP